MNKLIPLLIFSILLLVPGGGKNAFAAPGDFIDNFSAILVSSSGNSVFGPDGNLYVSTSIDEVVRFDGTTGAFIDVFVSAGSGGLDNPQGIVFGPDGNLYVVSLDTNQVLRFNGTTGAFIDIFASGGGLSNPIALTFGPDGNLYVSSGNQVLRYNGTTGAFIDIFTSGGVLGFTRGITFGPDGNLYASSQTINQVLRYDGTTGAFIDIFAITGGFSTPIGITFGPDENLYVSASGFDQVLRFDGTTGAFIDVFVSTRSGFLTSPFGLHFGPDGNLYVESFPFGTFRYEGILNIDNDNDGFFSFEDCNDSDNTIFPEAPEIPGDKIDQDCDSSDPPLFCGGGTIYSGNQCVPDPNQQPVVCGQKTNEILGVCVPDLSQICGSGTIIQNMMCVAQSMNSVVGGALLEINTVSLLVGAIGTNPIITGLVGITLAGIMGQTVWFVHRRKKKIDES